MEKMTKKKKGIQIANLYLADNFRGKTYFYSTNSKEKISINCTSKQIGSKEAYDTRDKTISQSRDSIRTTTVI